MTTAHAQSTAHPRTRARGRRVRWIVLGVLALAVLAALYFLPVGRWVEGAKDWFEDLGPFGPLVFVAIYVAAELLLVPASALTLAAGGIFGLWFGLLWASVAANAVALIAFLLARHVARGAIERKVRRNRHFRALDETIGEGTWKVVLLLRLSPIVPFGLANYGMGLTSVGFWPFLVATSVGMLPGTFLYVYLGWVGAESVRGGHRSPAEWALLGLGLLASAVLAWWLTRAARAKLSGKKKRR